LFGFSLKNVGIYYLAKGMKDIFNKKVGITTQNKETRAPSWRDKNFGYDYNLPERFKFEL
jgi:hypothetical protein